MDSSMATTTTTAVISPWVIYVEIAGAVIGIALTVLPVRIRLKLGGVVGTSLEQKRRSLGREIACCWPDPNATVCYN